MPRSEESLERRRAARREWYRKNRDRALASNREWKKNNPDKIKAASRRRHEKHRDRLNGKRRFDKYGVTQEQYDEMVERQNGVCAICSSPPKAAKALSVDHDHNTGSVRGLLCDPCNLGLGLLGDSLQSLQAAVEYLGRWQEALEERT